MRECRIVFAQCDGQGDTRADVMRQVQGRLIGWCGGYTMTLGVGAYTMASGGAVEEAVFIFDYTDDGAGDPRDFARGVAKLVCSAMGQESIYWRDGQGQVYFLT